MPRVQGHSIEEQWDLSQQFEALTERALAQTVDTYLALATGKVLTAAAGFEGNPSIHAIWQQQVDASLTPFLYATFESAALGVAHDVANGSELPDGAGVPLVPDDHVASYVAQVSNKMVGVSDDLWQQINVSLQQGVQLGESVDELAVRVQQAGAVTTARAQATARTTVVQASNAGSLTQMQMLGDDTVTKEWLATEDTRTRHDHSVADGQKRQLTAAFDIGGWPMQYPGDPAGPADEVINCRCTIVYNYDTQPAYVCDCASADKVIAAAGYLKTPTTVPASSCVCPVTSSLHAPGYVSIVEGLNPQIVFKEFMKPGKISPAYGGAKIHKQLEPIKKALGLTDEDSEALLKKIDEAYLAQGGKSSFAQKYEEWLDSAAGKKVVKVPLSAPPPIGLVPSMVAPAAPVASTFDVTDLLGKVTTDFDATAHGILRNTIKDINYYLSTGKDFDTVWAMKQPYLSALPHFKALTPDERLKLVKAYKVKYLTVSNPHWDVSAWPDSLGGVTSTPAVVTAPAVAPVVVAPAIVTPATVTTPAIVDLLDISTVTPGQVKELAAKFKAIKPVTPNWGGSAIVKTLQEAKKSLGPDFAKFNDGQLLKMLDQGAAAGKTGKTFFGEAESWLKTPAGKKYATDAGLPALPVTPAGAATTGAIPAVAVTAPVATPTAAVGLGAVGDISGIDPVTKKIIFNQFKFHNIYLSSPPADVWDELKPLLSNPTTKHLTPLQFVRVLDELSADKAGVTNTYEYEKKLTAWMKTKAGQDHIAGIAGPPNITLPVVPRNISLTDTTFADLSNTEAQAMQDAQAPWTVSQKSALRYYTGNNYTAMNTALRKNTNPPAALAGKIRNAQGGMRASTRPMMLYRGTGLSQLGLDSAATLPDVQALVGKTMEDKGFMSTSTNVRASFSGRVKLEIEAPTGSPMAFVKSISHFSHEDEMLLAAGTRYRVLSVTEVGHTIIMRVRIVP